MLAERRKRGGREGGGAHLEEDEKVVELLLERSTVEARSACVEQSADEADAEAVVGHIDRGGDVGVRTPIGCSRSFHQYIEVGRRGKE